MTQTVYAFAGTSVAKSAGAGINVLRSPAAASPTLVAMLRGGLGRLFSPAPVAASCAGAEGRSRVFESLPFGIVVIDTDGRVADANPAAANLLGQALCGEPWREVLDRCFVAQVDNQPEARTRDGRLINAVTTALAGGSGQVVMLEDVTLSREVQRRLDREQQLIVMGNMLAGLAHQMRTPLAAAMLYISHISRASLGTRVRRKLEGTLRHMDQLVTNMLFYARGRGLPMAPVALEALLADVATLVQPIAAAHECRVEFLIGIPNKLLQVNRDAVATAVQNLIINALQACGRGGEVRLYALEQQEDRIELRVSDNGPGIPDDLKQRIFEPFFSTRAQGSGLGLAVARALIQAHDGDIWVKSEPGHGTTFGVTLPVLAPRAGDRNPAQQAAA